MTSLSLYIALEYKQTKQRINPVQKPVIQQPSQQQTPAQLKNLNLDNYEEIIESDEGAYGEESSSETQSMIEENAAQEKINAKRKRAKDLNQQILQHLKEMSEDEMRKLFEYGDIDMTNNEELIKRLTYFMQLKQSGRQIPSPSQSSNSSNSHFNQTQQPNFQQYQATQGGQG